jgi:hypothetical protein
VTAMSPSPGQTRTAQGGGISPSTKCSISPVAKFRARKPMGGSSASRLSRREAGPSQGLDRRRFVGTSRLVLAGKTVDGALPAQPGREQGYGYRHQGGAAEDAGEFVLVAVSVWFGLGGHQVSKVKCRRFFSMCGPAYAPQ